MVKYKTSRISFFYNYTFALFLILFLFFIHSLELSDSFRSVALVVCIPLIAIVLAEPEFVRIYTHYLVEEDSITMVEGLLSKKKVSIPLNQIAGITLHKTLLGRMLKFGNIKVSGFRSEVLMRGIKDPDSLYKYLQERLRAIKKKK
ncbi:MAG: PH domain-containing protein [Candidatus Aenigmatarchaeota archaeon]